MTQREPHALLKVLIACEFSGVEREAFRARGHDAISCDLLPTEQPGPHHQCDIVEFLQTVPSHYWDIIILHPTCTRLCVSGNRYYGKGTQGYTKRLESAKWTESLWNLAKLKEKRCALENPVGVLTSLTSLPKPQYIQPWMFGHTEKKKTALFLHNLPNLLPTNNVFEEVARLPKKETEKVFYASPSKDRWKKRSLSYTGIADAMADQWGSLPVEAIQ